MYCVFLLIYYEILGGSPLTFLFVLYLWYALLKEKVISWVFFLFTLNREPVICT